MHRRNIKIRLSQYSTGNTAAEFGKTIGKGIYLDICVLTLYCQSKDFVTCSTRAVRFDSVTVGSILCSSHCGEFSSEFLTGLLGAGEKRMGVEGQRL